MMGERQTDHPALFYEFSLERHVPGDHLLRSIDRFVDLGDIREQLRPFYSDTGRPSVDPELMIRMLIVVTAWASAQSGACAKRFTSTSPIAGSAGWVWTARCPTTRPSLRGCLETFGEGGWPGRGVIPDGCRSQSGQPHVDPGHPSAA